MAGGYWLKAPSPMLTQIVLHPNGKADMKTTRISAEFPANDKRRARLNMIRHMLHSLDYEGKDEEKIGKIDKKIIGSGPPISPRRCNSVT